MAFAYLLDPSFQTLDENGRPLVGGYIEVYRHNTSVKYVTKADFEGTDNPFKVPLNSKGMAVIIASDQLAYDVFCYDRFGALYWSRQNVNTIGGSGGGGGGGETKAVLIAKASSYIAGDDDETTQTFTFTEYKRIGDAAYVEDGKVKCNKGVYQVHITIGFVSNATTPPRPWIENVTINHPAGFAIVNIDRSINETYGTNSVDVGFDLVVESDGTELPVSIVGLGNACYATLQHFDVNKIAEVE